MRFGPLLEACLSCYAHPGLSFLSATSSRTLRPSDALQSGLAPCCMRRLAMAKFLLRTAQCNAVHPSIPAQGFCISLKCHPSPVFLHLLSLPMLIVGPVIQCSEPYACNLSLSPLRYKHKTDKVSPVLVRLHVQGQSQGATRILTWAVSSDASRQQHLHCLHSSRTPPPNGGSRVQGVVVLRVSQPIQGCWSNASDHGSHQRSIALLHSFMQR